MMALESGPGVSVQSSPTLSGVHFPTPSSTSLRQMSSSHQGSSSSLLSSSPMASMHTEGSYWRGQNDKDDNMNDENISALDPRRFTPNLHASLVSEILSLRREIEGKNSMLGNLEEDLQAAKADNDQLNKSLQNQASEGRSAKKQMHLLESGTRSALDEMAKERDEAVGGLSDARRRLEMSKNKLRAQEEEAERTHGLWDRDRQVWDVEKRNLDRKIHVVEGRLRTILAEVATAQAHGSHPSTTSNDVDEGMRETWFTKSSDSNSNRSNSVKGRSRSSGISNGTQDGSDAPNFRSSTLSGLNGLTGTSLHGLSLAEELEFDEEEENAMEESDVDPGVASPGALPEEAQMNPRRGSLPLHLQDEKARKVLGLLARTNERLVQEAIMSVQGGELINEKLDSFTSSPHFQYTSEATQYSPPSSSLGHVEDMGNPIEKSTEQTEHVANQRRKRVSILTTSSEQTQSTKSGQATVMPMVSAGCQTLEPLSPPQTPVKPSVASDATLSPGFGLPEMKSAMTQTSDHDISTMKAAGSRQDSFMLVPTIAIHPPASRPPSSHNSVVLPPQTKSAACQVSIPLPVSLRSVAVQTEEIKRPPRIPLRVISSSQYTDKGSTRSQTSPRKSSRKNVQRASPVKPAAPRMRAPPRKPTDSYPGNNDNGPLKHSSELRRPVRSDSLFAGFESKPDQAPPRLPQIDFSDDELTTMAPIRKTLSKVQNSWKLIPNSKVRESIDVDSEDENSVKVGKALEPVPPRPDSPPRTRQNPSGDMIAKPPAKPPNPFVASKHPDIRKSALISSGTAAHTSRARSPSAPSASSKGTGAVLPPFPVPTRSSSRKIAISASDGTRSPTPYSTSFFSGSQDHANARASSKNAILRKVRSATAVPRFARHNRRRSRSRSPPASESTWAPDSPQLPRLPQHDRVAPRERNDPTPPHSISPVMEHPADSENQPLSVVDAIAQTMVGEWIWKYVRRRKSFGISESPQIEFEVERNNGETNGGSGGTRHKRWVWLAPYERAIMWSSKQPTSGPALLGKSGRKLTIQSVIDVKDDTPMPKHSDPLPVFDRSILILTPQRALKFTASNRERHQIWLTALAFLSNSALEPDGLASIPPIPRHDTRRPPSQGSLGGFRRVTIRDSIGIAKSKGRPSADGWRAHSNPLGVPGVKAKSGYEDDDPTLDAAEPPYVPRVSSQTQTHTRKRSNTGPRTISRKTSQNFSSPAMPSNFSLKAHAFHDGYPVLARGTGSHAIGQSVSDGTGSMNTIRNNFFDAVGTVRMEAFIDQGERAKGPSSPGHKKKDGKGLRTRQGRKKDLSYWGVGGPITPKVNVGTGSEGRWKSDDPFKGF